MFVPAIINTIVSHELLQVETPVNVCNLDYLKSITRGDEKRTANFADTFVTEIDEELKLLKIAIEKLNYPEISNISHKMKSAIAILGIKILEPVINEMEQLSIIASSIDIIKQLSNRINIIFDIARSELNITI